MKLFLVSAAAAALIFITPAAFADPPNHHHGDKPSGEAARVAKPVASPQVARPATTTKTRAVHTRTAPKAATTWRGSNGMVKTTASPGAVFNAQTRGNNNNRQYNNYNNRNDRRDRNRNNYRNNNRGGVNVHLNFNRRNVTARHHYRYRGDSWRWPHGYSYRRWTYGMTLPSLFWAQQYWISDYSYYGLRYPPPGTVWVRYGNDAVLIDRYSGEILEVVYGQFY
jgi:Ni/Co efflux regulator RcnB